MDRRVSVHPEIFSDLELNVLDMALLRIFPLSISKSPQIAPPSFLWNCFYIES